MSIKLTSSKQASLLNWTEHPPKTSQSNSPAFPFKLSPFPNLEEQLDQSKEPQAEMVLRVAANLLTGGLGTGGKDPLDGMQPIQNFLTWEWVLNQLLNNNFPINRDTLKKLLSDVQSLLNQCADQKKLFNAFSEAEFLEMVKRQTQTMKNLGVGESYSFYGGWGNIGGGSGHALMYEVKRSSAGFFDFRLYTSTDCQLADNLFYGDKRLLLPVVCWDQIPKEYLFASTGPDEPPVFFQQLFEMDWSISRYDKNAIVNEDDILETLDYLEPFLRKTTLEDFGAKTGQKGGTCLPSSTKTWASYHFSSLKENKIFGLYFDLILTIGIYEQLEPHLKEGGSKAERQRTTFIYAAQAVVGAIDKLVRTQKEALPEDLAFKATKQLHEWIDKVEKISRDLETQRKQERLPVNVKTQEIKPQQNQRTKDRYWITQSQCSDNCAPHPSSFPTYLTLKESEYLSFLEDVCKTYEQKRLEDKKSFYKQAANLSLHHAIDALPLPPIGQTSPWKDLGIDTLLKCCAILRALGTSYLKHTIQEDLPPRRFATLFAMYAIIHHLACLINQKKGSFGEGLLSSYSVPFPADKLNQIDALTFHDVQEFERIEQAKKYFNTIKGKKLLFQSETDTEVVKNSIHESRHNAALWEGLIRSNEQFRTEVNEAANKRFPDYSEEFIEEDFKSQQDKLEQWYQQEKAYQNKNDKAIFWSLPKKPPNAQKLQNLPLLTKQMLVLEEFDSDENPMGNSLLAKSHQEINEVRLFALLVQQAILSPSNFSTDLKRTAERDPNHYEMKCSVYSDIHRDYFHVDAWNWFIHQKQYLPVHSHGKFLELPQTKRDRDQWKRTTAEAEALDQKNLSPLLYQSIRTLSEWKLTPHQLLLEWGKDFEHLKDPELQGLFLRLFFRSPVYKGKVRLGAGELFKDSDLLENVKAFVSQGLSYFMQLKKKEGAKYNIHDMEGVKFLFELTFLCQKYLVEQRQNEQAKQIDFSEKLDEWIQDNTISRTPRSLLRLYRLLSYSITTPIEQLTTENLKQIFVDWTVIHLYSDGYRPSQISPLVFRLADDFIAKILEKRRETFNQSPQVFCQPILLEVEKREEQLKWSLDPAASLIFIGTTQTNEKYQIDLRRGEVFTPTGKASRTILSRSWEDDPDFKRVFWEPHRFEYTMGGQGAVTFTHPRGGFFRILLKGYHQKNMIQRLWGGEWYQYIPPDQIKKETLGLSVGFAKDHLLWGQVKVDKVEEVQVSKASRGDGDHSDGTSQMFFKTLTGQTISLEIDFTKSLQDHVDQFAEKIAEKMPDVRYVRLIFAGTALNPNETLNALGLKYGSTCHLVAAGKNSGDNILDLRPPLSKKEGSSPPPINLHPFKGIITSLATGKAVWAIDAKEGQVFEVSEEGDFVKKVTSDTSIHYLDSTDHGLNSFEDPDYILTMTNSKGKIEQVHFPRFRSLDGNPLFFIRKKGTVLVWNDNQQYCLKAVPKALFQFPIKSLYLERETGTKKEPGILLIPFSRFHPQKDQVHPIEEWESIPYFEYQTQEDLIIPQSLEGRFYLAYLYFQDQKYDRAIEQITLIDPIETISPLGFVLLDRIRKVPPPIDHPDAAMVSLQAALQLVKGRDRQSDESVTTYFGLEREDIQALHNLIVLAHQSLQSARHISEGCRISDSEKRMLFQKLIDEAAAKCDSFQRSGINYPAALIEHLGYWLGRASKHEMASKGNRRIPENRNNEPINPLSFSLPSQPMLKNDEKEQAHYETDCRQATLWLASGTVPFLVNRWPVEGSGRAKENGKLLSKVLEIAKQGTPATRLAMLWKVRNWRLHWKGDKEDLASFDLMIQILLTSPRLRLTKDISESSTGPEKVEFLKEINRQIPRHKVNFQETIANHLNQHKTSSRQKQGTYQLPPLFNSKEPSLDDFGPSPDPLLNEVKGNYDKHRLETLKNWREDFFTPLEAREKSPPIQTRFSLKPGLLSKQDKVYQEIVQKDLDILTEDFNEGSKQLQNQKEITLNNNTKELLQAIDQEQETFSKVLEEKEREAKEILNQLSFSFEEFFHRIAQTITGTKKSISLDKAREALLTFDKRAFKVLNPGLKDQEITTIAQLLLDIEDLKSWKLQLQRMKDLVTQGSKIADPQDVTKRDVCRRLLQELEAGYHFNTLDPEMQVVFRIFCGETDLIPFKKQVDLITEMLKPCKKDPSRLKDCVGQLIMGSGKTAVIAALLMQFLARQKGKIAFFIVPAPLFKSVSNNLTESLKKSFNQQLEPLHVKRNDLTLYRLKEIEKLLDRAKENPIAMITTPSSLQVLELEFLSQIRKLKDHIIELNNSSSELEKISEQNRRALLKSQINNLSKLIQERLEKIRHLARIVRTVTEHGQALIDEIDLILDALLEVNFPDGTKIPILAERNHLVYTIFSLCMQEDLRVNTLPGKPLLQDVLHLRPNLGTSEEVEDKHVFQDRYRQAASVLASQLILSFAPFQTLPKELQPSLYRFLMNEIPFWVQEFSDEKNFQFCENDLTQKDPDWEKFGTILQLKNDAHFLSLLNDQFNSNNNKEVQFAKLVALATHLLNDILPVTLCKNGNRHYGPVPLDPHGKMCPYEGVDAPVIDREFGYVWEELCYYYQWACLSAPEEAVILELARLATEAAHYYMKKNGELFDQTAEYQQFKTLTGVSLQDFQDPGSTVCKEGVQKAKATLQNDPKKRLLLQKELAAHQVKVHALHLSSNGASFSRRFRSRDGMSATLTWNVEGYRQSLAENVILDKGTEGKVLATLSKKVTPEQIHKVPFTSNISTTLTEILKNSPHTKEMRGFIDAEGILKIYPNIRVVAEQVLAFLKSEQEKGRIAPEIDTVLFFSKEGKETQANTLYMWKMGMQSPEKIGGTTLKAFKAKGLDPRTYFVIYDEMHTTGTDIVQVPNAVNLFSFGPSMLLRRFPQGSMRLRQLLFSQNVEIVIDKAILPEIYNQGQTIDDLMLQAAKNQSIRKIGDMPRYCKAQINEPFRFDVVERLLDFFINNSWNKDAFLKLMNQGESYFVHQIEDNLSVRLKGKKSSKDVFKNRLTDLARHYPFPSPRLAKETADLLQHIDTIPLPPYMNTSCEHLGMENEVEAAVEVDVNVAQEQQKSTEVDEDIEKELQLYENIERAEYRQDQPISYEAFCALIALLSSQNPHQLTSLSDQLKKFKYGSKDQQKHYEKIFSEPIYGTESYFNACTYTLPVFHRLQRPPTQILVVRGKGGVQWLLLSEHESQSVKKHIQRSNPPLENVWFIQPNGAPLAPALTPFPLDDEEILQGLLEINVFNGNADWLGYYEHYLAPWLVSDFELKIDFLKLRTARHPHQRQILAYLPSILRLSKQYQVDLKSNSMLFSERAERESQRTGPVYTPGSITETKLLRSMKQIEQLSDESIPHLGIDPINLDDSTQEALNWLKSRHPGATPEALVSLADNHSKNQIKLLQARQIRHLTAGQIKWMQLGQVRYLTYPHQIMQGTKYYLDESQVQQLTASQAHLIPFVNPLHYPLLTLPEHIQNVPPKDVDRINPKYGCHLLERQIKEGIKTVEQLKTYTLLPSQWPHAQGKLIEAIPPNEVTKAHIQQIQDKCLIQSLHTLARTDELRTRWIGWLTEDQLKEILSEQFEYLQPEQAKHLVANQVQQLTTSQTRLIPFLNPLHYPLLTLPEHIQNVPPKDVYRINPKYGCHLLESQIKEGIKTVEQLKTYTLLPRQWPHVQGKLIEAIPPNHVTETHIQQIQDKRLIQSLHTLATTDELRTRWIEWLTEDQLKEISSEQFKYHRNLPSPLIQSLSFWKALYFLTPTQLKHRTVLQKAVHILAIYVFGCIAHIALVTRISHLFHATQSCQWYSSKMTSLTSDDLMEIVSF